METYKTVTTYHHSGTNNSQVVEAALETTFGFPPDHVRKALAANIWLNINPGKATLCGRRRGLALTWGTVEVARSLADLDRQLKSAFTHLHEFEARRQRLGLSSKPMPVS